ncbi:MAG: serine/threonine protein kinase [Deltaproteobacteria bacterium]|nr:serine/threonine protein kinase [Deltaproteobacteria bacterium]
MRASQPPGPAPGTSFGPFVLEQRIAVGGMAEIFLARQPDAAGARARVVVKRLLPLLKEQPEYRAMFETEARLGTFITHPNVVEHLGGGQVDGHPYCVMEYVFGVDAWQLIRRMQRAKRRLDPPIALHAAIELLHGLHAVHTARDPDGKPLRIIHRDVSPTNIYLSSEGDVKLADLGIARSALQEKSSEPGNTIKGKFGYLAPEQVLGMPFDQRADIFAAGIVASELLICRPLFTGGSQLSVLLAIRDVRIDPLLERAADLPPGVVAAIQRALAKDPDDRYESAIAFARDLEAAMPRTNPEALREGMRKAVRWAMTDGASIPLDPTPDAARPPGTGTADAPLPGIEPAPPTAPVKAIEYWVQTTSGKRIGPLTFAKVVELIATSVIGGEDRVSTDRREHKLVRELPDLARHIPPRTANTTDPLAGPAAPDLVVRLESVSFVHVLATLALRAETGLLLCEAGSARKEVYFQKGRPEFVTSNLAGELLGEYLVAHRHISRGELDMALAMMPRFDGRLGDTLVGLGLLESVQLFQIIVSQVKDKIIDLFRWRTGSAAFYKGVPHPESGFPLGLDSWSIIVEGVERTVASLDCEMARHEDELLVPVRPAPHNLIQAPLPQHVRTMLASVGGPTKMGALLPPTQDAAARLKAFRSLYLLVELGALRWDSPSLNRSETNIV